MIATNEQSLADLMITVDQQIHVNASLEVTFQSLLEQLGPGNETPDGKSIPMTIEPWPGGRWYRDLGDGNGHFWANVKAIVKPSLLEFVGPLFASFPFVSNVQYRLKTSGRRHSDRLPAQRLRLCAPRSARQHGRGLGGYARARSQAGRGSAQLAVDPGPFTYHIPAAPGRRTMSIAQSLLAEFEEQAPITRRYLERLPADKLSWRPHPRSMTAGQLAYHLALVPGAVARGAQQDRVAPPDFQHPHPESRQQILDAYEQSMATVREVLPAFDDAAIRGTWRIMDGDKEVAAMPRVAFLRNILLNHCYQHRGQFAVYLRLLDVAVPASWGPSADEPSVLKPELQPA